ncbi:MAG: oligoendopeptidase F [Herpetosiphonaceae bacterium]|nr:oligoendopeptidase F [Herpetosiphonaceae bacterium]
MTNLVLPRSAIRTEATWDAISIYPSDAAWEAAMTKVSEQLPHVDTFRGKLGTSAALLADWFAWSEELQQQANKISLYASMLHNVDTADQAAAAQNERAVGLYTKVQAALSFAEPELLAVGLDTLRQWVATEPRLQHYAHYLDQLTQRAAHVGSAEVEELLSQVLDPFYSAAAIHGTLADTDLVIQPAQAGDGQLVDVAQGNINALLTAPDRELRRTAWEQYADAHLITRHTMANCLATGVKQDVFMARARRYPSSLEAAMQANHIPTEVFHNLIQTFQRHLPTWHRYWQVRRKALGYDQLHVYDIKAPLTKGQPHVPFEQAVEWIGAGMRPLGDAYVQTLQQGVLDQRWVDRYPNQGKRAGAYSHGVQGTHPFILMSYTDDLFSMSTLAHELGHSLHSYHTWQAQPHIYADYSMFVAEVASNFNQALVRAHLLATQPEPQFQIALLEEAMSNFHRYFFIMPTLARFELAIHERVERGEALTADSMMQLMTELFQEGYGAEVVIDADRIGITWAQFPTHLYANFYVYQYATGIAAAHALAQGVIAGQSGAAGNYTEFLKAGSSRYPLDALQLAGVDMRSPAAVEQTFAVLAGYVERLAELTA